MSILRISLSGQCLPQYALTRCCLNGTLSSVRLRLLDVNPEGSVPVVKDNETSEWFVDSAKFVDYLEDKHPEPALGKSTDVPEA